MSCFRRWDGGGGWEGFGSHFGSNFGSNFGPADELFLLTDDDWQVIGLDTGYNSGGVPILSGFHG